MTAKKRKTLVHWSAAYGRYVQGGMLVVCSVAVLVALVGYDQRDIPWEVYPANDHPANPLGWVGAWTAFHLLEWLGAAAYVFSAVLCYWGLLVLGGMGVGLLRSAGMLLLVAALPAALDMQPLQPDWMPSAGGMLGAFISSVFVPFIGWFPSFALFLLSSIAAFFMVTDVRKLPVALKSAAVVAVSAAGRLSSLVSGLLRRSNVRDLKPPVAVRENKGRRKREKEEKAETLPPPTVDVAEEKPIVEAAVSSDDLVPVTTPAGRASSPRSSSAGAYDEEDYRLPPWDLLDEPDGREMGGTPSELNEEAELLCRTLAHFGISSRLVGIAVGPVVVQYQIEIAAGTKVHKVMALSDDIAMALRTSSVRIVAPIPGKSAVGIEVPRRDRITVRLKELLESDKFDPSAYRIPLLIGKDNMGEPVYADLVEMPHLLIAGATGSGKTICLHSLIMSMLMLVPPSRLKLLLVDPKMVEMSPYRAIPHLIGPVVTDMKKAPYILHWATVKMDERYDLLAEAGVRSIDDYNDADEVTLKDRESLGMPPRLPYIVVVIDELADLMAVSSKEVESSITRLAQKSRAVGIHLILATQRPSVDVITGLIKANMPARISFRVTSRIDSRTILDRNGAEKLLGRGDMLMIPPGSSDPVRLQGTFISDREIKNVVEFVKSQAEPEYYEDLLETDRAAKVKSTFSDPLYDDAVRLVIETQRGSASMLQRRLGIGYTRASRLIEMMEDEGIVGPYQEAQSRKVLVSKEEWEKRMKAAEGEDPEAEEDGGGSVDEGEVTEE